MVDKDYEIYESKLSEVLVKDLEKAEYPVHSIEDLNEAVGGDRELLWFKEEVYDVHVKELDTKLGIEDFPYEHVYELVDDILEAVHEHDTINYSGLSE